MFTTRLISGIVLVIIAAFLLVEGSTVLYFGSMAISLIGLYELYRVMKIERSAPGFVGYAAVVAYYWIMGNREQYVTFLAIISLMILMTIYVVTFPKYGTEQITVAFFGIFYVGIMFSYLYQVREMPDGKYLVWLILLSSWGCDTFAYCAGKLFGKHKMTPKLSPKKTVEGAIGGVLGTMVFGVIITLVYSVAANRMEAFTRSNIGVSMYVIIALLGCVAAVLGIYGDLFASVVKRQCGIKDYGTIFPGHGGILDRFDSVMFIAPFVTMVITAVFYY